MSDLKNTYSSSIKKVEAVHDFILNDFKIKGKSLEEWQRRFNVVVPQNPDIVRIKELLITVSNLIQECVDISSGFKASRSNIKMQEEYALNVSITELSKTMSNVKAEKTAINDNQEIIMGRQLSDSIVTFFDDQTSKLKHIGQLLTTLSMLAQSELKYISNNNYSCKE